MVISKLLLNMKIMLKNIIIIFLFLIIFQILAWNYLEEYVTVHQIIIEDAKGFIELCYEDENKKLRVLKKYPVEFVLTYDIDLYKNNVSFLKQVLTDHFRHSKITSTPTICKMWSYSESITKERKDEVLTGETLGGIYKNIPYKFIYFIQDADGYDLDELDKLWPFLRRCVSNSKAQHFFDNEPSYNRVEGFLRLDVDSIKIRRGTITQYTSNHKILTKYYKEIYKWRPTIFLSHRGREDAYQLITVDLPMNNYYVDVFNFKHKTKGSFKPFKLSYLKKIYTMKYVDKRITFIRYWLFKYDKYDKIFR